MASVAAAGGLLPTTLSQHLHVKDALVLPSPHSSRRSVSDTNFYLSNCPNKGNFDRRSLSASSFSSPFPISRQKDCIRPNSPFQRLNKCKEDHIRKSCQASQLFRVKHNASETQWISKPTLLSSGTFLSYPSSHSARMQCKCKSSSTFSPAPSVPAMGRCNHWRWSGERRKLKLLKSSSMPSSVPFPSSGGNGDSFFDHSNHSVDTNENQGAIGRERKALFILFILLIFEVGRFITRTAVPVIMIQQYSGDTSTSLKFLNQLSAASALLEFLANPVFGSLSDRLGRRPFIILGTLAQTLSFASVTFSPSLWPLVISRLILTANPVLNMCHAAAADLYQGDLVGLTRMEGRMQFVKGLAITSAAAAGGALAQVDVRIPYAVAAVLSAASFITQIFFPSETLAPEDRKVSKKKTWAKGDHFIGDVFAEDVQPETHGETQKQRGLQTMYRNVIGRIRRTERQMRIAVEKYDLKLPPVWSFLLLFRHGMLFAKLNVAIALQRTRLYMGDVYQIYTRDILGWGPAMAGVMYSVWGFMASLSGLVTAQAVQFFGAYRLTQATNLLATGGQIMAGCADTTLLFLMSSLPASLGVLSTAAPQALLTEIARQRGIGFGELSSARANIGAIVRCGALLLFGQLYGVGNAIGVPGLPFLMSGLLLAIAQIILLSSPVQEWEKVTLKSAAMANDTDLSSPRASRSDSRGNSTKTELTAYFSSRRSPSTPKDTEDGDAIAD